MGSSSGAVAASWRRLRSARWRAPGPSPGAAVLRGSGARAGSPPAGAEDAKRHLLVPAHLGQPSVLSSFGVLLGSCCSRRARTGCRSSPPPAAVQTIRDSETGLLVDAADPSAVVRALRRVLDDRALAARLGETARAMATGERGWANFVDRLDGAAHGGGAVRVALVHDYLVNRGGAERVVAAMHRVWPDAPIFTSLFPPPDPDFAGADVRTSRLQRLSRDPAASRRFLPLFPRAFASFDLSRFDVVVS